MRKPNAPTRPQWGVLRYIYLHTQDNGYQPSQAEIALHFGWTSPNAVAAHIRALKHKGWIDVVAFKPIPTPVMLRLGNGTESWWLRSCWDARPAAYFSAGWATGSAACGRWR